jgi:adenylate cyclase
MGPAGGFAASGGVSLALSYLGEGRQRRRLRKSFAHYLGEEMIDQLLRNPAMLALGGERRELSVLFSDIRGFTTLSERLTPLQLVAFLNTYLTPMTRAVLGTGGFLDKYIGDAVMAVFGAPVPSRRHASQALECALRMHLELEKLQPRLQAEGVELKIGVGVNTGEMVAGNMGAEERFDYTVVGDSVNLASRLEGLTKGYGVFCLVGDAARSAAEPEFRFREIDLVQVKGKHEPVAIHELLSGPQRTVAEYREPERFERALAQWRAGELEAAREGFAAFAALNPGDRVAPLYLERIADLNGVVPSGWNGVFVHTSK